MELLGKKDLKHKTLAVGIVFLFIVSSVTPLVIGFKSDDVSVESDAEFLEKLAHANYDRYDLEGSNDYDEPLLNKRFDDVESDEITTFDISPQTTLSEGLMDSAWPMFCHDIKHTGRSPYNTTHYPDGLEKWRFYCSDFVEGSAVIDNDGVIYFGSWDDFYALYPNGTLKWKYPLNNWIESSPAIGVDGVIYVGLSTSFGDLDGLFAFCPNGTLKWNYGTGRILSSPAIGEDGTIYFGTNDGGYPDTGSIYALNPNGTLKWRFRPGHLVYSSPAIGEDGTIYCGCHDEYLYALYPNGTLKWKFKTGHWIRVSPCIADDGTIYCVSLDGFLYALYPNGTLRWKTDMGEAGTSPSIGHDGTIYAGYNSLFAIEPNNGSIKWTFTPGDRAVIEGGTPCISYDGVIYFGTRIRETKGGEIIALNLDGTERWRKEIANDLIEFAPIIGSDGTVYIGSTSHKINDQGHVDTYGYLYAFGFQNLTNDANGPYFTYAGEELQFDGWRAGGIPPFTYRWDFGDGTTSYEQNPVHIYSEIGNYTATFSVTDSVGNHSNDDAHVSVLYPALHVNIKKPRPGFYILDFLLRPFILDRKPVLSRAIWLEAEAYHDEGLEVVNVKYYANERNLGGSGDEPYSVIFDFRWEIGDRIIRKFTLKAVATDSDGLIASDSFEVITIL